MKSFWVLGLTMVLLMVLPEVGYACPVCFDANDENRQAFITTAALLTLLPLGMVGGAGLWMRKRMQAMDQEDAERGPPEASQSEA